MCSCGVPAKCPAVVVPRTLADFRSPHIPARNPLSRTGDVFISDSNNLRVRAVDRSTSIISGYAGSGSRGFSGDGGPATSAAMSYPFGLAMSFDGSTLYIADEGNNRIRAVDTATRIIVTIAGTGVAGFAGDGLPGTLALLNGPTGVAADSYGWVYIADSNNNRVRVLYPTTKTANGTIETLAGNGVAGFCGDGGAATSACLRYPYSVSVAASGAACLIADTNNHVVRSVNMSNAKAYVISTVAGTPTVAGYAGDGGPATAATLNLPQAVSVGAYGSFFIADMNNEVVRKVS